MFNWRGLDAMTDAELLNVSEAQLQFAVVTFLQDNYPEVPFKCDTSAVKMTIGQARKMKMLGNTKDWPDLFVARPMNGFHGLFIELKRDGTRMFKKHSTGDLATEHLEEQLHMLIKLRAQGYMAIFSIGWKAAKKALVTYLEGNF